MSRSLGIDYGRARIGLALSDESKLIASPLDFLPAQRSMEKTIDGLMKVIEERGVDEVVIGLPIHLSGEKGEMALEVERFAELLGSRFSGPIHLVDERLVTVQVERAMKEGGLSRKKRSKKVDSLSAVLILQSHLEKIR